MIARPISMACSFITYRVHSLQLCGQQRSLICTPAERHCSRYARQSPSRQNDSLSPHHIATHDVWMDWGFWGGFKRPLDGTMIRNAFCPVYCVVSGFESVTAFDLRGIFQLVCPRLFLGIYKCTRKRRKKGGLDFLVCQIISIYKEFKSIFFYIHHGASSYCPRDC